MSRTFTASRVCRSNWVVCVSWLFTATLRGGQFVEKMLKCWLFAYSIVNSVCVRVHACTHTRYKSLLREAFDLGHIKRRRRLRIKRIFVCVLFWFVVSVDRYEQTVNLQWFYVSTVQCNVPSVWNELTTFLHEAEKVVQELLSARIIAQLVQLEIKQRHIL